MAVDESKQHEPIVLLRRTRASDDEDRVPEHGDSLSVAVMIPDFEVSGSDHSLSSKGTDDRESSALHPYTSNISNNNANKILFLDGVRGLAVILVVTHHSGFMHDLSLGASAVDMFFVLSAFLLTLLFFKKSEQLLKQEASIRKWFVALLQYSLKRLLRVYPLFAILALVLWVLPFKRQNQYFMVTKEYPFDLLKVLTFDHKHRYHLLWTLPLEIEYYFMIPALVASVLALRRYWWTLVIALYVWIIHEGFHTVRWNHIALAPHLPTFVAGSLAAILVVKLEQTIKRTAFAFRTWHKVLLRGAEYIALALLVNACFRGQLLHWITPNVKGKSAKPKVAKDPKTGPPFISLNVTLIFVIELLAPSWIARMFEWSVLRYWGKISFSVYLLHTFVVYTDAIRKLPYYDKLFTQFLLVLLLASASHKAVETPCQTLAARLCKALEQQEGHADVAQGASFNQLVLPSTKSTSSSSSKKGGSDVAVDPEHTL